MIATAVVVAVLVILFVQGYRKGNVKPDESKQPGRR